MHAQIRRVGVGLLVAFLAVFAQLNYVQIFAAEKIASNPANIRSLIKEYSVKRGDIITADDVTIATSKATGGRFKFKRTYPEGELFGHISGFYSITFGATRLEASYNDQLLGEGGVITMQDVQDRLFGGGERGDDVITTVTTTLQQTAREALGDNRGAIVAMDPGTGEVLAMWSNPSYDPGPLATFDAEDAGDYYKSLDPKSPTSPLVSTATSRTFPPGSTFKVVTTAAALESGRFKPNSTFDDPVEFVPPQTTSGIRNFSGGTCAGGGEINLADALRVSCNTTFAQIGLEVHEEQFEIAEALGFNQQIPFDVGLARSVFDPADEDNLPRRALAGIGQGDVASTPLQMALVAATVANGGSVPRPTLVREVIDPRGGVVHRAQPESLGRAFSERTASTLTEMMVRVVDEGTGTNAQIPGVSIAGKTGTAQSAEGAAPHAWFIAFAPAANPKIAVAVFVENGGTFGQEATGGTVAAPMAKAVIETDRRERGW
ncbi:MAG TPA: penicillin-binding protein 2 [Actinomycetota bacterium]|nr:penicillin-binding protein 2 [Actinomycetota bacterium]